MFNKIVIFVTLTVFCASSECEQERQLRQYTREKRGKFSSNPPLRFYNRPPPVYPIKGPFSYTPPPFMVQDEPSYPGSRPYKVSKKPTPPKTDGLGDEDIANLVKYMSKQDLDKILEFAQSKDQNNNKYKDFSSPNEFIRPFKRDNRNPYKGNVHTKYQEPTLYKEDAEIFNFVTDPSFIKFFNSHESSRPVRITPEDRPNLRGPISTISRPPNQWIPNEIDSFTTSQGAVNSQSSFSFPIPNNHQNEAKYVKVFTAQEPPTTQDQIDTAAFKPGQTVIPNNFENHLFNQAYGNLQGQSYYPVSNNPQITQINEEEKLPPPVNMREDFEVSYTNNVPKVVTADSYDIENFGDLPLMEYNSKLHDVSSYHVPHYTVTQPKPSAAVSSSSSSSSSSVLLKPSPAAAGIIEPVYESAPPVSAAAEQSDAHLKATKIWSYQSKGAAYTLHDDGSLSPERNKPAYG